MTATVVERGIVFAERDGFRHLELDVYRPAAIGSPLPVIHQVHGGGWRRSHRGLAPREARGWSPTFFERMVSAGFVVVASSYRFSGEALYPAAMDDTFEAVRWIQDNVSAFGGDPDRQILFGQSAGGYLAAAAGLATDLPPARGVICWYPLTDPGAIPDDDPACDFPTQWLGAPPSQVPDLARKASLPARAHAGAPPFLLQHGTADTMAPFGQSERLADALRTAGVDARLHPVEGAEHFFGGEDDAAIEALFATAMEFAVGRTSIV
jgi:acetyl esterase/lipase